MTVTTISLCKGTAEVAAEALKLSTAAYAAPQSADAAAAAAAAAARAKAAATKQRTGSSSSSSSSNNELGWLPSLVLFGRCGMLWAESLPREMHEFVRCSTELAKQPMNSEQVLSTFCSLEEFKPATACGYCFQSFEVQELGVPMSPKQAARCCYCCTGVAAGQQQLCSTDSCWLHQPTTASAAAAGHAGSKAGSRGGH